MITNITLQITYLFHNKITFSVTSISIVIHFYMNAGEIM